MFKPKFILALIFALALATVGVCNSQKTRELKQQSNLDGPRCLPGQVCPR